MTQNPSLSSGNGIKPENVGSESSAASIRFKRTKEFARFSLHRYSAWAEWIGGIAGGNVLVEAGTPRTIATAAVVGAVYKTESFLSSHERERLDSSKPFFPEEKKGKRVAKDVVGMVMNLWQGAASMTVYNHASGLGNTPRRNNAHSAAYASIVGYWVSPFPYANEARDYAADYASSAIEQFKDDPVTTSIGSVAIAAGFYGAYSLVERLRNKES